MRDLTRLGAWSPLKPRLLINRHTVDLFFKLLKLNVTELPFYKVTR